MFVDVILPLSLQKLYSYAVPADLDLKVMRGKRAVVQFGAKKLYTALIRNIHNRKPAYETKEIFSVLDEHPVVNEKQFMLWDWIASYYMCTRGDVMSAALPSGLKLESESRIGLQTNFNPDELFSGKLSLTENEFRLLEALHLKKGGLSLIECSKILHRKNVFPFVQSLITKGLVMAEENLISKYKPKTENYVRFTETAKKEEWLQQFFEKIEKKSPKQLLLLMTFIKMTQDEKDEEILKSRLLEVSGTAVSVLNQLIKKNVFEITGHNADRLKPFIQKEPAGKITFSDFQEKALSEIEDQFRSRDVVLLRGVTSSGKTEIYIQLIEETIAKGKQVLYLLPEIALTSQIIRRLQKHFGNRVGVYHSRFSDNERVEVWNKVLNGPEGLTCDIILGARSAIFLPFRNLGLIIVDEEHENSFKQQDPAPRYNARDTAIVLAKNFSAKVILGSATPSVETVQNARSAKFGLVEINQRFGGIKMPEIVVADVREAQRKKLMKSHFTPALFNQINSALKAKEQIILFQNRRGFAPYLECPSCGWTPHCVNCDVSLVFHKQSNRLRCHYCGFHQEPPNACLPCGETAIKMVGFGTEKIEEELQVFFPEARIARLDMDTARTRSSFQHIILDFERRLIDVLVGTQMVTKGLDFDNVSTVGIMNADSMLKFPDFRAHENSFQLMAQVSGRSGRKTKQGKVIIQALQADHPVIGFVVRNDYKGFYENEMAERNRYGYPPFVRLVEITLKHRDIVRLSKSALELAGVLKNTFGKSILGPEVPQIARVRNLYLNTILFKIDKNKNLDYSKKILAGMIQDFKSREENRSVIVSVDVDPI